jgi:hypothetical protein
MYHSDGKIPQSFWYGPAPGLGRCAYIAASGFEVVVSHSLKSSSSILRFRLPASREERRLGSDMAYSVTVLFDDGASASKQAHVAWTCMFIVDPWILWRRNLKLAALDTLDTYLYDSTWKTLTSFGLEPDKNRAPCGDTGTSLLTTFIAASRKHAI